MPEAQPHAPTVAVVTGGTQGVGQAVAEALIAEGCRRIVIAGRRPDRGEAAASALSSLGADVRFVQADMADPSQAAGLVDAAEAAFGPVTALGNAAASSERGSLLDTRPELFGRLMATNLRGTYFALQRLAQRAITAGKPAACVNILSMVVHCG